MTKQQAQHVATALHGIVWQPCCNTWLVIIPREDGSATVIGSEGISEYHSHADLRSGDAIRHVVFKSVYVA